MSQFLNQFSRRKFLLTVGASAVSSIFLKGCLGNPPDTTTQVQQVSAADINPAQAPETPKVKLGYIPIVEAAPLIIAKEKGFFAKYGMTEVELAKQASWVQCGTTPRLAQVVVVLTAVNIKCQCHISLLRV
jgi:bicarbonate transport system substrate-binding protein